MIGKGRPPLRQGYGATGSRPTVNSDDAVIGGSIPLPYVSDPFRIRSVDDDSTAQEHTKSYSLLTIGLASEAALHGWPPLHRSTGRVTIKNSHSYITKL